MAASYRFTALVASIALLLSGCATRLVESYTSFHTTDYSSRSKDAELYTGTVDSLLQDGYLLLGHIDFTYSIQSCFKDYTCNAEAKKNFTTDYLLRRAALKGADKVQILDSSLELKPTQKSVCTHTTPQIIMSPSGTPITIYVCGGYAHYAGHSENWQKLALLWRYEPALAKADINYQAVQKALSLIDPDRGEPIGLASYDESLPEKNDVNKTRFDDVNSGVYGQQLIVAINNGNTDFIESQLGSEQLAAWTDTHKVNVLMLALLLQQPDVYRWLIDQPETWNEVSEAGYGVLEYAIAFATAEDVESLVGNHAYLAGRWSDREKIYQALSNARHTSVVDLAVSKGFAVDGLIDGSHSLLTLAIQNENYALVPSLLERGASPLATQQGEVSPLLAAAQRGHADSVELLLARKASVDSTDGRGNTPIHYASAYADPRALGLLLNHGADINQKSGKKYTPLHIAILKGRWDNAEFLMAEGGKMESPDADSFVEAVKNVLFRAPPETLAMFLDKTKLIHIDSIKEFVGKMVVACARHCSEASMSVVLKSGVNGDFYSEGKSLFWHAYEKENIGAMAAILKSGYHKSDSNAQLTPLQRAVINGDTLLVRAYRAAEDTTKESLEYKNQL